MGLISETVMLKWNGRIKQRYVDLGYKFTKLNDLFEVKIKDLSKRSNVRIKVKCDYCGDIHETIYSNYNRYNHNGKYYCNTCASKILNTGENHPNWNPNLTDEERELGRKYPEYYEFIRKVLARDNYACQCCGKQDGRKMEVHHLDGYDWCIKKRTDETNGITLCHNCHRNFHNLYGLGGNTKEQFEEWHGQSIELLKYEGELSSTRKIYCIEEDKIYDSSKQLAKEWRLKTISNIHSVCNHKKRKDGHGYYESVKGKHLLWLDEYEKMEEQDIIKFLWKKEDKKNRSVICLTTGKIFKKISDGAKYYNCDGGGIGACCREKLKTSGKLEDGTKLQWKYIADLIEEEYIKYDVGNKLKELIFKERNDS